MQDTIHIGDALVLEAHPEGRYSLLRCEGVPDPLRIYLNEVRHLADAVCAMVEPVAGSPRAPACVLLSLRGTIGTEMVLPLCLRGTVGTSVALPVV